MSGKKSRLMPAFLFPYVIHILKIIKKHLTKFEICCIFAKSFICRVKSVELTQASRSFSGSFCI